MLLVQTRSPGFDIDAQETDLKLVRAAFEMAKQSSNIAGNAQVLMTGPGVFAVETRAEMKRDTTRFSIIANRSGSRFALAGLSFVPRFGARTVTRR